MLLLVSCFKKEDAIQLPSGETEITSFYLGENYSNEVFFDLGSNSWQTRKLADWDLRFQSGDSQFGVFVNNGTNVLVRKIDIHNLDEPLAADTLHFRSKPELVDAPEGKVSGSAIGDWRNYKSAGPKFTPGIYVIELGYGSGYKKFKRLQLLNCDAKAYYVRITDLYKDDNITPITKGDTLVIPKDANSNYTYYSFKNGGTGAIVPNAEPEKNSWDIVFTRYKHLFYGILPGNVPYPYILTGVLSNPNKVLVAKDSSDGFSRFDGSSIAGFQFSDNSNAIGYDWKSRAWGAQGTYTANAHLTYFIRDTDGQYYKLRFLDFMNAKGENGYPKFEFVRIR